MRPVRRLGTVVLSVVWLAAGLPGSAAAQTIDELIAKNIEAKGGLERLKAASTVKLVGKVRVGMSETPMTIWMKRPNMVLQERQVEGQKIVQAFDGERAWMLNPFVGVSTPQPLPGPQTEIMKEQADFDGPLIDYQAKGNTLELVGPEKVGRVQAFKVRLTRKNGQILYLYLDAETGLEMKTSTSVDQGGRLVTVENVMTDYQRHDGIMMPHTLRTLVDGQVQAEVTLDSVEFGTPIDDSLFQMQGRSQKSVSPVPPGE
jgi:outer membrane lipoprotein-sorting protein